MRVGIVGFGSIGTRYARIAREKGWAVAAFDSDPTRLSSAAGEMVAAAPSLAALLASGPDFVIVSTPPANHLTAALAVLDAGIPLLVEKPLADAVEPARLLAARASAATAPSAGVCNMRFHPGVRLLKVELPLVGRPLAVKAHFGHRLAQMRPPGLSVFASGRDGGGVILDCIHEIDYLQWMLGPLSLDWAVRDRIGPDPVEAEDWSLILLTNPDRVKITLHLDFVSRHKRRGCEIIGTDGTLIWMSEGRNPENCSVWFADVAGRRMLFDGPVDPDEEYRSMLAHYVDGSQDMQSIAEAVSNLVIAEAARQR